MKKLLIILVLFPTVCFAGIDAKIINKELTEDGFIRITTRFVDNKDTISELDDEQIGTLDYRLWNPLDFIGKTKLEIENIILEDLRKKAKGNILFKFRESRGELPEDIFRKEKAQVMFDSLPDTVVEILNQDLTEEVDINGDNIKDEIWNIKTDGTFNRTSL